MVLLESINFGIPTLKLVVGGVLSGTNISEISCTLKKLQSTRNNE